MSHDRHPDLLAMFESQLRFASDAFTTDPFLYQMAKFITLSDTSYCLLEGGIESLKHLLLERIAAYGGNSLSPRQVESLTFERAYLSKVLVSGYESTIHPRYVLWNRPLSDLASFLPDRIRYRRFKRRLSLAKPTHYRFCVQYDLPADYWPVGMHDQALLVVDPRAPYEGENCFYIERLSCRDNRLSMAVHYVLQASALTEPPLTFRERHERIREHLLSIMPFTGDNLRLTFPKQHTDDHLDPFQETLFPLERDPFDFFLDAAKLHPVYEGQSDSFADLFPFNYKTPAKNLFLSSPEILMHFGLDGKVILAKKLSQILRDRIQQDKAKALRKKKRMV